jgi:hypothetical protein
MIFRVIIVKNVMVIVYVNTEGENIDIKNVVEVKYVNTIKISLIVLNAKGLIDVNYIINLKEIVKNVMEV